LSFGFTSAQVLTYIFSNDHRSSFKILYVTEKRNEKLIIATSEFVLLAWMLVAGSLQATPANAAESNLQNDVD